MRMARMQGVSGIRVVVVKCEVRFSRVVRILVMLSGDSLGSSVSDMEISSWSCRWSLGCWVEYVPFGGRQTDVAVKKASSWMLVGESGGLGKVRSRDALDVWNRRRKRDCFDEEVRTLANGCGVAGGL